MICKLGVWDDTIPGIEFDDDGVSNYAKIQLKLMEDSPRGETGDKIWKNLVDEIKQNRKNNKYDCIKSHHFIYDFHQLFIHKVIIK